MGTFSMPSSPHLGDPGGVINKANEQIAAAGSFLAQLGDAAERLVPPIIDPEFPEGPTAPGVVATTPPALAPIVIEDPERPATFTGELTPTEFPTFTGTPPALGFGEAPNAQFGEVPDVPAINTGLSVGAPTITLPDAPALLALSVRAFEGLTLPTFDETAAPELTVVAPNVTPYEPGTQYTSALLTALQTSLRDRIENGGTGLNAAAEQGIYDRARERELKAVEDALLDLERMETMGFMFPPGVYVNSRLKISTEFGKVSAGLSRDIMVKQAELELANVQEALKTATQLESVLLDDAQKLAQRLFEAAKYTTEAGVAIFNSEVQAFAARMEAYKTRVAVYEARIRAEIARVEAYRAEIAAEEAKAQINTALVQQYRVQVDAALANVEVYKAQIQGTQVQAQLEKLKVEIYGEQVRAFATKVSAYTAEVEGFKAGVQAEGAKQEAYRSQVEAYRASVDAAAKAADTRIAEYRGAIDLYTARWEGYKAEAQAASARAQAIASSNASLVEGYRAEAQAVTSYNEVLTKQWQVMLDQNQRTAEIAIAAAKASGDMIISTRGMQQDAAKVGAQVAAQLGAAALNALNWSNSFSISGSTSNSYSKSISESDNTNTNL